MRNLLTGLLLIIFSLSIAQVNIGDNGAIVGAKVQEVVSWQVLLSQNEQIRLVPASLTKIITTATVLELLGAGYQYKTDVFTQGDIKNGVLKGDIVVRSSGDPTLGSKFFGETQPTSFLSSIAEALNSIGVKKIEGSVYVESDSISHAAPRLWEDMGNYYGASPQGFNWADNTIEVTLKSGKEGTQCKVESTYPFFSPYALDCRVVAASHNKDSAYVYGVGEIRRWWIEGSIPQNRATFKIKAAMPNPEMVFRSQLVDFLQLQGIEIKEEVLVRGLSDDEPKSKLLLSHRSPSLSEIIKVVNHKSNNLFADQLLLTLAKEQTGVANWDNGNRVVQNFWKDKIDFSQQFRLRDGSGLTPKNLVSPGGMVELLIWMRDNSKHFGVFEASLAMGGETGTLKSVFRNPKLKGRVIGKSGSMEGVLGYCGYLTTLSGKKSVFCIIANNYLIPTRTVRKELDDVITNVILNE